MKEQPKFSDKEKAEIVREARVAVDTIGGTDFWKAVRARLDENGKGRTVQVEKRG